MNSPFEKESFWVADLALSELRLFDHQSLLWLILVPKRENVVELIDLSEKDRLDLWAEITRVSHFLKDNFPCDKLNIATLGNIISQLHIHVIARRFDDPYFPKSPFGYERLPYTLLEKNRLITKLQGL